MSRYWACLIGQPVAHTLSPALHNAAFAALGIDAHYDARDVSPEELAAAVADMRSADCLGGNVTAPHKQAVIPLLDELFEEARAVGAVNTVVNRDGRLIGGNTDAAGLARWMRQAGIDVARRNAMVLGAGGAAHAAVWALLDLRAASITIRNRTTARAKDLVERFGPLAVQTGLRVEWRWGNLGDAATRHPEPYALVINATSLGHHGGAPAVDPSCYSPGSVALELVYNPPETDFMRNARAAGARAENGLGMLLHQAALAFERWTGREPPMHVYEAALKQRVGPA